MDFISAEEFLKQSEKVQKVCLVNGCNRKSNTLGYCQAHYMQLRKHGKILNNTISPRNEIIKYNDKAEIILYSHRKEIARTLIDNEDIEKIKSFKWVYIKTRGYVKAMINGKEILLHRFILNTPHDLLVDHINHNKLDNRKSNLRFCNKSQNAMNLKTPKNNTSGTKGVYWDKRSKKWYAKIKAENKNMHLGYFDKKEDAIESRINAEKKYFGEFSFTSSILGSSL